MFFSVSKEKERKSKQTNKKGEREKGKKKTSKTKQTKQNKIMQDSSPHLMWCSPTTPEHVMRPARVWLIDIVTIHWKKTDFFSVGINHKKLLG